MPLFEFVIPPLEIVEDSEELELWAEQVRLLEEDSRRGVEIMGPSCIMDGQIMGIVYGEDGEINLTIYTRDDRIITEINHLHGVRIIDHQQCDG